MTDEHAETDTWPAPWILPTRHLPDTVSDDQPGNGREDTPTVPDAATGDSERRDRYAEAIDGLTNHVTPLDADWLDEVTASVVAVADAELSALSVVHEREVAELRAERDSIFGKAIEFKRMYIATKNDQAALREAVLSEAAYFGGYPGWLTPTQATAVSMRFRAALAPVPRPVAEVGAAGTETEGAGEAFTVTQIREAYENYAGKDDWGIPAFYENGLISALRGEYDDTPTAGSNGDTAPEAGRWVHVTDGSTCAEQFPLGHRFASTATPSQGQHWWCTTHQSHLRWEPADAAPESEEGR